MSLTKWPTTGCWKLCFLIAEIASLESPSKIVPLKPSSRTNRTARLAAIVSSATMDEGRGIISDSAAKTSPEELRTTAPILQLPNLQKLHRQSLFSTDLYRVASKWLSSAASLIQVSHKTTGSPLDAFVPTPRSFQGMQRPHWLWFCYADSK